MRRILPLLGIAAFSAGFSGCLYTNIHQPFAYRTAVPTDVKSSIATDPIVMGTSCSYTVLGLVAWGDAGYAEACRKALKGYPDSAILYDVKTDLKVTSVFIFWARDCTEVTGRVAQSG
jgi:hypothetical protein